MKVEINNLTALIQGRDLTLYQRSLAVEEWHKLLNHVDKMEQALSLGAVVGQSEQLVCPHCQGKGEYIDTHPERYGLKTCECQRAK